MSEAVAGKCSRCGSMIWPNDLSGRWKEQVVCAKCHAELVSGIHASNKPVPSYNSTVTPPAYRAVEFAGTLQIILGWITISLGLLLFLLGGITLFVTSTPYVTSIPLSRYLLGGAIIYGFMFLISGIFTLGFGQLLHCIRDMARNSFYLKRFGA